MTSNLCTGLERPAGLPHNIHWQDCKNSGGGQLRHKCFAEVIELNPPDQPFGQSSGGYLMISDDTVFDPCRLQQYNASKIWYTPSSESFFSKSTHSIWDTSEHANTDPSTLVVWHWGSRINGGESQKTVFSDAMSSLSGSFREKAIFRGLLGSTANASAHNGFVNGQQTDIFYVPDRYASGFVRLSLDFAHRMVHHELAIPNILYLLLNFPDDLETIQMANHNWYPPHILRHPSDFYSVTGLSDGILAKHPVKLSNFDTMSDYQSWWSGLRC